MPPPPVPRPTDRPLRRRVGAGAVLLGALLAGCAGPGLRGGGERDGPEATTPPDLAQRPDAEPRIEPIRPGGPNKPYVVGGQTYVPLVGDAPFTEHGLASWYGRKFSGRPTASGEPYDMYAMTAAHPTLPIPSYARVRNPANGREVIVRINDRGPFVGDRIVDLSYTAALKLDLLRGVAPVDLERITVDDIHTGAWRRKPGAAPVLAQAASAPTAPRPSASTVTVPAADALPVALAPAAAEPAPVDEPPPARTAGFWVQLGAFRVRDGAAALQKQAEARVEGSGSLLSVFADASLFRLQAGPYVSRDEARAAAERFRTALGLVPVVVERR